MEGAPDLGPGRGPEGLFYSGKLTVSGEGLVINSGVTLYGNNSYSSQSELILINGITPSNTGVTTRSFTISGSVPSCAF